MQNGMVNPAFFKLLQETYQSKTGYNLVLSDPNGSIQMGLPDCDKFPCMKSCRECREHIVCEALRTGKVCIDTCHEGYTIWGLPFASNGTVVGGLVVIGGEHKSAFEDQRFRNACSELYKLMDEHDLLPDSYTFDKEDFSDVHRFVYRRKFEELHNSLKQLQRPFLGQLQTADYKGAESRFKQIRNCYLNASDLPLDVLRGLLGDLIYDAKRQFIHAGMDTYACTSEAGILMNQVSAVGNLDDVENALNSFFQRFKRLAGQRPKDQDDLVIERATTYMEEHLRENLTRESVARAVGISPSHFSRLIREKKGRTFTDLLNQYRIERATKLLVRSAYTLAHIANETGFCDQSYFSKVFRRYKDMSPAQYRELIRS